MVLNQIMNALGGQNRKNPNFEETAGTPGGDIETFTEGDADTWNGDNLTAGQWVDLWVYQVEAQTGYTWGYSGRLPQDELNVGTISADLKDGATSPNNVNGELRLVSRNANDKNIETHGSYRSRKLREAETNAEVVEKLAEKPMDIVGEDSKLVLQFKLDSSSPGTTADQTNSIINVNGTEYSL